MNESLVEFSLHDGVAEVTLNRPQRHNALVPALLQALSEVMIRVEQRAPRAMVLSARGPSFSTGGDVAAFHDTPRDQRAAYAEEVVGGLNGVILQLLRLPVPTVAAVHGMVTGGSLGLVLACDLVVADPRAAFTPWYTVVGFSPDGGWTALLPERIGRGRALDLQLRNASLEAGEAHASGLVQCLAEEGQTRERALALAAEMHTRWSGSVRGTLALTRPDSGTVAAGLEAEKRAFVAQIVSDEAEAGMAAFLSRA